MSYVFDSSSLIYLGKIKILDRLKFLKSDKIIPLEVYKEVVEKGFERMEYEAKIIDELIKERLFVIKKGKQEQIEAFKSISFLSKADKEILAIAREIKAIAIIDETYANSIAETFGIKCHGSIYLILLMVKNKVFRKKEAIEYINRMIQLGFYFSTEKYREVLAKINMM
ncbi:DUF3368 domain-containing protein [Candidatus Pacearchaeota archaeon]|nr:DUF3368 domain-containing protein [Candidatus Pacearchaeota archaeon]